MARTPSTMVDLGVPANHFNLPDAISGNTVSLADFANKQALLVMFICQHCPFVQLVEEELGKIGQDFQDKGLGVVAIMSNDLDNYPDDKPEKLREQAERAGFNFPYLVDETQEIAKKYNASCTPDFFLFDEQRLLVYRGQLDDARPDSGIDVTGSDLRNAIAAVLKGEQPPEDQKPSIGCNIKWKPGNEPTA